MHRIRCRSKFGFAAYAKLVVLVLLISCLSAFPSTPSFAQTVSCSGVAAWSANSVHYAVGALVTYDGDEYKCLQAHTSEAGWDPPAVPALWSLVGVCSTASCTASPSAPGGLSASGTTSSGTNLSWTAVTPPSNCSITSYTIYKSGTSIGTSTSTSFSVTGLSASTTYTFTVAATDSNGTSGQSSSITVTTSSSASCTASPSAPSGLTASGTTSSSTSLSWTAVTPPSNCSISSYTVYKSGTSIGTSTSTSFSATGLSASTTYTFTVAATDSHGTGSQSSSVTVTTSSASCAAIPSIPTGLAASSTTTTSTNLTWSGVTPPTNCSITSYTVYKNGTALAATSSTSYSVTGLSASTTYTFAVAASDSYGTGGQTVGLAVTTSSSGSGSGTTGSIGFHVSLGVDMTPGDTITLTGDNYTDLIMSNVIAGVMYAHIVKEGYPGIQFNQDYLVGSIFGELLQENLATEYYVDTSNLIDPSSEQAGVLGVGQGGPYQINNYAVDMVGGTTTPQGHSMINYIAIQKNIGYTMSTASTQDTQPTPASFNNKYYGPMLPAYFHYNDLVSLEAISTGPWQPYYDETLADFVNLPNSFLDIVLNIAYNQGYYGGLLTTYCEKGATATASTVTSVNSYSNAWGSTNSYQQYPYQVHYYLDQLYDNPIPTTSVTTTTTPSNHVEIPMSTLETVFENVFELMDYSNGTAAAQYFTESQAQTAFNSALSSNGVSSSTTYDLSNASNRATIENVINSAISNLETTSGMKFNATTLNQL